MLSPLCILAVEISPTDTIGESPPLCSNVSCLSCPLLFGAFFCPATKNGDTLGSVISKSLVLLDGLSTGPANPRSTGSNTLPVVTPPMNDGPPPTPVSLSVVICSTFSWATTLLFSAT